ncbi:nuclear transport factor 2 family protein [Xanthomonas sp. AmX2]|uniref:nuclear transport factor 2 family protein n=1 Tax=Xanthomonas sp. TaxID=29446 RepID=UPI0019810C1C|nr:nuclear transport factor 2 family protein [Xanthomonas sp.]MBN6151576.1 nuclear transport factor 2 family protein [Xanthomonas sp.]
MGIEENKRSVEMFCGHFGHAAIDAVLAMMSDDATWWINGKPHLFPGAGSKTKAQMAQVWHGLYARLVGGLRMEVVGMIAEGDRVAAEVRSRAVTRSGKIYQNDYHMLFRLRGGKVVEVKEYTDLMHAAEVFG